MENQHRMIKGYRDLSESEIAAMNSVKELAEETRQLIDGILETGVDRRSVPIALQQGFMALVRSIAKP